MEKKEAAFVLGATGNLDFATANVIAGIKKHIKNLNYDIVVFEQNFSNEAKDAINKIYPSKFITYEFPIKFSTSNHFFQYFTEVSCSIYECLNLLDQYKYVIWLDCDILIQKDFSEAIKNTEQISVLFQDDTISNNFRNDNYEYDKNIKECNSGIVFFADKIKDYKKLAQWCYKETIKYADILTTPDQTILSIMYECFGIHTNKLSNMYNCMPFDANVENAYIVHTPGGPKMWEGYNFNEWEENNKIWEKLIGRKVNIKRDNYFIRKARTVFKSKYNIVRRPRKFVLSIFNPALNYA